MLSPHRRRNESNVWVDEVSTEIKNLISMANELDIVPWENTAIPSDKVYYTPDSEIFSVMVEQLLAVFVVRVIALINENNSEEKCESMIKASDLSELRQFIKTILEHYNAVDYHSSEHALHVTLNSSKFIAFLMKPDESTTRISYGIQSSAMMQFAFIFAALIHDVQHLGVTNYALTEEEHELAILYSDQSMLEQQSLTVAFREFLKPCYSNLRTLLFSPDYSANYNKFRRLAVDLVLCTDTASPERMQLTRSKFLAAFGEDNDKHLSVSTRPSFVDTHKKEDLADDDSWESGQLSSKDKEVEKKDKQSQRRSKEESKDININNVTNISVATNGDLRSSPHKLGIRIALDFTGLTASRETKVRFEEEREKENDTEAKREFNDNLNQEDPLKAQVILELMIRAADVGATSQSFENFTKWGRRLYFEQKTAFEAGRGEDPDHIWLTIQIIFLENYAKKLTKSIEDSRVFGQDYNFFVSNVEANKRKWKELGASVTASIRADWEAEKLRRNSEMIQCSSSRFIGK